MNYQEIIAPYLIDFDKLEVGQTLWSVTDDYVKIKDIDNHKEWPITMETQSIYCKNGKYYEEDIYPSLFTSDPFANLQRVEPKINL